MRWMLSGLDGGPRRVNHAAVAVNDKIYSFGGYSANDALDSQGDFIDVHALNTFTYRWELLPTFPEPDTSLTQTKQRSVTVSGPDHLLQINGNSGPSTSNDHPSRRRTRSLSDLHPLAQIRAANPPLLEEEADLLVNVLQRRQSAAIDNRHNILNSPPQSPSIHLENQRGAIGQAMQVRRRNRGRIIAQEIVEEEGRNNVNARQRIRELFNRMDADLAEMASEDESGDSDYVADEEEAESVITEELNSEDTDYMDTDEEADMGEFAGPDQQMMDEDDDDENPTVDLALLAKLHQHPEIPFKRYGHTVVAYKGLIYLWGGRNDKLGCNQTLHCYDPAENRWSIVPTEGECPPARDGHTAIVDKEHMYIFGGFEEREHRFSQETYCFHFSSKTWSKLKTHGESPQYRDFHAACVLDGKMYVFGGRSDEMGQLHTSHDLYCDKTHIFDLKTHQWHQPEIKGLAPCGRRSHTMWTYQGAIYMFGGYQSIRNVHFNDFWRFDPASSRWNLVMPSGHGPSPRRRMCTVVVGSRVYLFGGTMPNPYRGKNNLSDLGDLFVLDFSPSLASLCSQAILKNGIPPHAQHILPTLLLNELKYMSLPNNISKSTMLPYDTLNRG